MNNENETVPKALEKILEAARVKNGVFFSAPEKDVAWKLTTIAVLTLEEKQCVVNLKENSRTLHELLVDEVGDIVLSREPLGKLFVPPDDVRTGVRMYNTLQKWLDTKSTLSHVHVFDYDETLGVSGVSELDLRPVPFIPPSFESTTLRYYRTDIHLKPEQSETGNE